MTGVSRHAKDHGSNIVYKRLRDRGYEIFPVNPNAPEVEGDVSYRDLASIPGGVEAVVIATKPEIAEETSVSALISGSSRSGCTVVPAPGACRSPRRHSAESGGSR